MRLEKFTAKRAFIVALAVAVALIAVGVYNVWKSFQRFDNYILDEKDDQFYTLMRSDDINIENSINSFVRETETYLGRDRVKNAIRDWRSDGSTSGIKSMLQENTMLNNPIYADLVMFNKDKIFRTATGRKDYTFITARDANNLRLCRDDDGVYYMAYDYDYSKNIKFAALMNLTELYSTAVGTNPDYEVMLMDSSSTLILKADTDGITVKPAIDETDEQISLCKEYMIRCQDENRSAGTSLQLEDETGKPYTARLVVMPSGSTVNSEFAMGIMANYEEALAPSRAAASGILIYGSLALIGIMGILLLLVFQRRMNNANTEELRALKRKNEVMEEINQKMRALSHHQRLETIGTMTASIAHDFNNLLTPIMGYSIMTMEMLPADATDLQENLMEVYNASVKAKEIVTRLADLSKKGNEENYKDIEVNEVVQSSLKVTLPAKPKNVEVKASFAREELKIRADLTQISQMVMNIVLNAYDAMREDGGTVKVSTRRAGDEIIIGIKDNGCGMDAETLSRIFDPFYTTKESGKGTGLGLAIVAQIIETHGGRIYVESEPGEGTEFRIYLPRAGSGVESLSWGPDGEGKFDTKRYDAAMFRRELEAAEAKAKVESDKTLP